MRNVGRLYTQSLACREVKVTPFSQNTLCLRLALNVDVI
jgi:hypothetical protein